MTVHKIKNKYNAMWHKNTLIIPTTTNIYSQHMWTLHTPANIHNTCEPHTRIWVGPTSVVSVCVKVFVVLDFLFLHMLVFRAPVQHPRKESLHLWYVPVNYSGHSVVWTAQLVSGFCIKFSRSIPLFLVNAWALSLKYVSKGILYISSTGYYVLGFMVIKLFLLHSMKQLISS